MSLVLDFIFPQPMGDVDVKINWNDALEATKKELERINETLEKFKVEHPEWICNLYLSEYPPEIRARFYLRGDVLNRRRATDTNPLRAAIIREDEMAVPADFVADVLGTMNVLRKEKDSRDTLVYNLRVNYKDFEVRNPVEQTARH